MGAKMADDYKPDEIDLKILSALQKNSDVTKAELAEEVGISTTPCWNRVRNLENHGFILGYQAIIDSFRVKKHLTFFVDIILKNHDHDKRKRFEEEVKKIDAVREFYVINGTLDYALKVVTIDIEEYHKIFKDLMQKDLNVERYTGHVVMECGLHYDNISIDYLLHGKSGKDNAIFYKGLR